jgi:hypothetical protein
VYGSTNPLACHELRTGPSPLRPRGLGLDNILTHPIG